MSHLAGGSRQLQHMILQASLISTVLLLSRPSLSATPESAHFIAFGYDQRLSSGLIFSNGRVPITSVIPSSSPCETTKTPKKSSEKHGVCTNGHRTQNSRLISGLAGIRPNANGRDSSCHCTELEQQAQSDPPLLQNRFLGADVLEHVTAPRSVDGGISV